MPAGPTSRLRASLPSILLAGLFLLAAAVLAGFFGDLVPAFDSLAHVRAHASLLLAAGGLALFAFRFWAAALACLVAAGLGLFSVYPWLRPAGDGGPGAGPGRPLYTLLQMNLRFDAADQGRALALIGAVKPDVVTLQELTAGWEGSLQALAARYPYQHTCLRPGPGESRPGDAAILSRRPFAADDPGLCDPLAGFAARRVNFNGVDVLVVSQHLGWPWPSGQWRQLARLRPTLAALQGPRIVGGDFNAAPWSAALATYAGLSGTRIIPGIGPSWMFGWLPAALKRPAGLPLDNILASPEMRVLSARSGPATASDHLPVIVRFTFSFTPPSAPQVQSVSLPERRAGYCGSMDCP